MKRKIIAFMLILTLILPCFTMFGCGEATPPEGTFTRLTVDVNPSIEFMIDDSGKVVSATALNDDGSILIAGEVLVGKTPEEAVKVVVSLATETGYLVKGNVTADENTVTISVSGDTTYAKKLAEKVENKISDVLKQADIEGKIEKAEALKTEALREMAAGTTLYSEEELNAMSDDQLYKVIAAGRIETALLLTDSLREIYFDAKNSKISFAKSEETAKIINAMGDGYALAYSAYKAALDSYHEVIIALDQLRYDMLVSPDSAYQKSLTELRNAKKELLRQKTFTASLEINGDEYLAATATLRLREETYEKALMAYENLGQVADAAFQVLIDRMSSVEQTLRSLEEKFPEEIKTQLTAKAEEVENTLNATKDAFFEEFEEAHATDIETVKNTLIAQKNALIEAVDSSSK